jgi:hypothetical protein
MVTFCVAETFCMYFSLSKIAFFETFYVQTVFFQKLNISKNVPSELCRYILQLGWPEI